MGLLISLDAEDKFICETLVLVNDYKCTKFQLPSSISFWDMVGSQNKKNGGCWSPQTPLADKFLYRATVLVNAYEFAKFLLPNSINFGDTEGVSGAIIKSGDADLLRCRLAGIICIQP